MWLLSQEAARRMTDLQRSGVSVSAAQQAAFVADLKQRRQGPRRSGAVAQIPVKGILTKAPDLFATLFLGGNTTYTEIQGALASADSDPRVERAELLIDSPGGEASGSLETFEAIRRFGKPITAKAENALSAAYGIAASADTIQATGPWAMFGSVGVAISFVAPNENAPVDLVELTNTDSPDKRPNVRTEEGQAVVVKRLDDVYALFVGAIAEGRGTSPQVVTEQFGRGAVVLAEEARRRGMIDSIASPRESVTTLSPSVEGSAQTVAALKAKYPEKFAPVAELAKDPRLRLLRQRVEADLERHPPAHASTRARGSAAFSEQVREAYFLQALAKGGYGLSARERDRKAVGEAVADELERLVAGEDVLRVRLP